MNISTVDSEDWFNPTLRTTKAGDTGLSNDQIFYQNKVMTSKPMDNEKLANAVAANEITEMDLSVQSQIYTSAGVLMSNDPLASLEPSFDSMDQTSLMLNQTNYKAMSPEFLKRFYGIGDEPESTSETDQSA